MPTMPTMPTSPVIPVPHVAQVVQGTPSAQGMQNVPTMQARQLHQQQLLQRQQQQLQQLQQQQRQQQQLQQLQQQQQLPQRSMAASIGTTTSVPRLSNKRGENNCFLNVVTQSLWHLRAFSDALVPRGVAPLEHLHTEPTCITCVLQQTLRSMEAGGLTSSSELRESIDSGWRLGNANGWGH
jgi:hypothetical protein